MKSVIAALTILLTSLSSFAHEGHDKISGTLTAPHGGQLKRTSQLYVEIVSDAPGFKLYTLNHELKTIPVKDVNIQGLVKFPKIKQAVKLAFGASESFLESKVNAKGSHRYTVDLKVTYKGKTEDVSFNVEPQE